VDNCCNTDRFVAAGVHNQLHDGRVYSHSAGHCHHRPDSRIHSATRVAKQSSCTIKAKETGDSMRPKIIIAIILIALGIAAFAYQGITYTTREKVVDIGPIQMTADKTKTIPLPPIMGAIALVGGIVLLVVGSRKD